MRNWAREYICSVFHWWWVMVIGFGGGGIGYAVNIWQGLEIPLWLWIVLAGLGIFVAQVLAFGKIRNELQNRVINPNQIEEILTRLADLREEGVGIRNDGQYLESKDEQDEWIKKAENWRNTVISEISRLSTAEASIFSTEDRVAIPQYGKVISEGHRLWLGILSQDTEKIRELVHRLSPQNLVKKAGIKG